MINPSIGSVEAMSTCPASLATCKALAKHEDGLLRSMLIKHMTATRPMGL